jgi:hypothetical protein
MIQVDSIVEQLKKEHEKLTRQIQGISAALSAFGAAYAKPTTKSRKISAAGRARIAEAQRQRWAKLRNATAAPKKRKVMSAAARKKISLAQKARWVKQKKSA